MNCRQIPFTSPGNGCWCRWRTPDVFGCKSSPYGPCCLGGPRAGLPTDGTRRPWRGCRWSGYQVRIWKKNTWSNILIHLEVLLPRVLPLPRVFSVVSCPFWWYRMEGFIGFFLCWYWIIFYVEDGTYTVRPWRNQ